MSSIALLTPRRTKSMCNSPIKIPRRNDEDMLAACRKCTECINDRKRRWVGRALAAQQTAKDTWFVTYTYGGGYENKEAYALRYSDLQKTFKKMRKAGHRFQYIAVGEYGDKERAHFHAMIFWLTEPPKKMMGVQMNRPKEKRKEYLCPFWSHGIVQYEYPRSQKAAAVYVMDYFGKNDDAYDTRLRYSKAPALGHQYLVDYAARRAKQGVSLFPDGPSFTVPGSTARSGKPFWYRLDRDSATYRDMLIGWLSEWVKCRPETPLALSKETRAWLWDAVQDVSFLPSEVREYLQRKYDIEGVHVPPNQSYHSVAQNVLYRADCKRIIIDNGGNTIWSNHLEDAAAPPEGAGHLTEAARHRMLRHIAQKAPLFCVKHVLSGTLQPEEHRVLQEAFETRLQAEQQKRETDGLTQISHPVRPKNPLEISENQTCLQQYQARRQNPENEKTNQDRALSPIVERPPKQDGQERDQDGKNPTDFGNGAPN
ncbi:replication initiator protein [Microviridae sp.]|nr:replication initiator protein [Microviridae sp.]